MANAETKKETLERLYRIIDTDATAISFQTLGQYRVFLRDTVRDMIKSCDGGQPSSVPQANELLPLVSVAVCSLKYDHHFLKGTGISECPECGLVFKQTER